MAELKTKPTGQSVDEFIQAIPDETVRHDCEVLRAMMERVTGAKGELWSSGLVGFGRYRYKYASGREGEWFLIGFAPRKRELALHVTAALDRFPELLAKLGTYRTGVGCLYVKHLSDVDLDVLEQIAKGTVAVLRETEANLK